MKKNKTSNRELTATSIISGVLLAILFGVANAYLGLRVGMTVSAAIPISVISLGVMRARGKGSSVLEGNMIQTIGSVGEALSAGVIFTIPALFLWAGEGRMDKPGVLQITLIAIVGGLLGVFFMIPLRNALVVKEGDALPYPEAQACAEVLSVSEKAESGSKKMFAGMGFAAAYKLIVDGLKLVPGQISLRFKSFGGEIGTQIYPAVMSVGYICGAKISSYMFAGGVLGWLILIPMIVLFGGETVLYPAADPISTLYAQGGASAIWDSYLRYIGAGALAAGGIISLAKSLPMIVNTFKEAVKGLSRAAGEPHDERKLDISGKVNIAVIVILLAVILLVPLFPVSPVGVGIILIFGFFFATVAARIVGLVGSSNSPVSGMTIATLLIAAVILLLIGEIGSDGMQAAIIIGAVICIVSAVSGDTSQGLKTGALLGASPKKQEIGKIIGVIAAAAAIGVSMYLLDAAWGFGSDELSAPQASLMKMIVESVMEGDLPWNLVLIGVFITVAAELLGVPSLLFAIGLYLPIHLSACVMIGGLVRLLLNKLNRSEEEKKQMTNNGVLFCSGMIAGEGVMGVLLAVLAVLGVDQAIDLSAHISLGTGVSNGLSALLLALSIGLLLYSAAEKKHTAS